MANLHKPSFKHPVSFLLLAFSLIVTAPARAAEAPKTPPLPVEAQPATVGPLAQTLEAVGTLRANEAVMLRPELQGRVSAILFTEAQAVKAGEVLIRLDDARYKAELDEAEANRNLSRANYKRILQLIETKVASVTDRDKAYAELEANEARLAQRRDTLAKTVLTAPFEGIVGLRNVSAGDFVSPGQDLVDIVAIKPIKVDFKVPEIYLRSVKTGQALDLIVDAFPGETFRGEVYAVAPQIDVQGRSLAIRASVPNPDGRLRPGLFSRVTLSLQQFDNAIQVPEEAIVPQGSKQLVYRIVDGKAEIVPVKLGIRRNAMVQIVDGLEPGDVVITAGQIKVRPGAAVTAINLQPKDKAKTKGGN